MTNPRSAAVSANLVTVALLAIAALLVGLGTTGRGLVYLLAIPGAGDLPWFRLIDLDREANLPSWFSAVLHLLCASMLFVVGSMGSTHRRYWYGLVALFLLLSLDEIASLHEMLNPPLRSLLPDAVLFKRAWALVGLLFVVLLGLSYWPFLRSLRRTTLVLFIVAGCVFVSGAAGLEIIGGWLQAFKNSATDALSWKILYRLETTTEELLEMLGLVIFLRALILEASERGGRFEIRFARTAQDLPSSYGERSREAGQPTLAAHQKPRRLQENATRRS